MPLSLFLSRVFVLVQCTGLVRYMQVRARHTIGGSDVLGALPEEEPNAVPLGVLGVLGALGLVVVGDAPVLEGVDGVVDTIDALVVSASIVR